jgi:hypothetical protein
MRSVELFALQFEATTGTPVVVLRELEAPHRVLPIVVGGLEATAIAVAISGQQPPRPLTHDLMAALVDTLGGRVESVTVTDVRDGTFLATLAITGADGEHRVDARPSDGIALAVRAGAPLYVADAVLEEAGTLVADLPEEDTPALDEAAIEAELDRFRDFLAGVVDPSSFAEPHDRPEGR